MPAFARLDDRTRRAAKAGFVLFLTLLIAAAAGGAAYVVQRGDTLGEIAAAHDTTVAALVDANGIRNPNLIRIGQTIQIPGTVEANRTHVVQFGEFLGSIAGRYDVSVTALASTNGLTNPNFIRVGQVLTIPSSGSAGTTDGTAPLVHMVQRGESLDSIARKYGVTVQDLAAANGMTPTSTIYVGTQLRVAPLPPTFTPDPHSTGVHIVRSGDTLGSIAVTYGTSVNRLVEINAITNANRISIGQRIRIPGGGWVCPVPGATYFNDWGFPRSAGRFHEGNDLFAARGSEVLAPESGTVEQITGSVGGLQFKLTTTDGTSVYYGTHLDAFGKNGRVNAGDVIGYVGDSGNARGGRTHLHFEIHPRGGEAINPYPLLRDACG
jgi:LysM repeat protein